MTMDLTVETGNGDGSKRRNGWVMMAPNAKTGNVNGSERWLRSDEGSERQTENSDGYECQNWEAMMALNAKLKIVMVMNAKTERQWWLRTPKLRSDEGSERQTENSDGSECQN